MDKFSYPDSAESSPRSRDIEFENPLPWEDQQQPHSYKVKFMCSYGGKIQPRPHDNQLTYVNGDTKIMSVDRGIRFPVLVSKLSAVCGCGDGGEISFKYQLPGEDLDALISVTNDDDLEHMMHEYDRLLRMSSKPARMRLFLFPFTPISGGFGSEGSTKSERYTTNPIPSRPESEKSITASQNNADFLFGSEKVAITPPAPSPVKVPQQIPDPGALEPLMFGDQRMIQNPEEIQRQIQEFQRLQIRDQEQQMQHNHQLHQQQQQQQMQDQHQLHQQQQMQDQHQLHQQQQQQQQEAIYRRKSEDGLMETGRYFTQTYAQNPAPTTISQTNPQPPIGYWQGNNNNNIPGNIYTTTSQNLSEQQVYMVPAQSPSPGTLYHNPMRSTAQGNQGYYPPVQRIHEQQNQPGYNVTQPQPPYSGGQQIIGSSGPMGLQQQTTPYSQMGNHVYYTAAGEGMVVQPSPSQQQYQGMGQPVSGMTEPRTGPDGKMAVNVAPKVSQSSDLV